MIVPGLVKQNPGAGLIDEHGEKYEMRRKGLSITMLGTNPADEKARNILDEQLKEQRDMRRK